MLISDNAGYRVYCEVTGFNETDKRHCIRFYTTFAGSKDPEGKQKKMELFLTDEELLNFKEMLSNIV